MWDLHSTPVSPTSLACVTIVSTERHLGKSIVAKSHNIKMSKAERLYQLERPPFTSVSVKVSNTYFSLLCGLPSYFKPLFSNIPYWVPFKISNRQCFYLQREFHTKFTNLVGPLSLFEPEDSTGRRLRYSPIWLWWISWAIYHVKYTIYLYQLCSIHTGAR